MPDHASWLTLILAHAKDTLEHNAHLLGTTAIGHEQPAWFSWEPIAASLLVMVLVLLFASRVRTRITGEQAQSAAVVFRRARFGAEFAQQRPQRAFQREVRSRGSGHDASGPVLQTSHPPDVSWAPVPVVLRLRPRWRT